MKDGKYQSKSDGGKNTVTGTYVFDKELNKVVKVSDDIPGVSAKGKQSGGDMEGCDPSSCGNGMCPMRSPGLD